MDLIILQARNCDGLHVHSGTAADWLGRDETIAVFPNAAWCQAHVSNALTHECWAPVRAPLACVLSFVGEALRAPPPTESDEPWAESDTVCSSCRREREASPPPAPHPADPSVPRLTTAALAQHAREHARGRSRSPVRAASPSAEASR
jgi:hypothetical protein